MVIFMNIRIGITWTKEKMRIKNLLWIKGYLATLTAADETQLAGARSRSRMDRRK
jgi:hypothetical protein